VVLQAVEEILSSFRLDVVAPDIDVHQSIIGVLQAVG